MEEKCTCKEKLNNLNGQFILSLYYNGNICMILTNIEEYRNLEKHAEDAIEKMKKHADIKKIIKMEQLCARKFLRLLPALGNLKDSQSFNASYHIVILSKLGALPQDFDNGIHIQNCELY